MQDEITRQIEALGRMTVIQLRQRWAEVFGEPTRSGSRPHLIKRIAWRIQALKEGGLSDRARRRAAELANDADLRQRPPRLSPPHDLAAASDRQAVIALPFDRSRAGPAPGTLLRREYRGQILLVRVLPKGFEFESEIYRSLTAIAKKVTGANWSGQHFFGLEPSRTRRQSEVAS